MKEKQKKVRKEQRGDTNYSEKVRAKRSCCALKLDFLQLIRKVEFRLSFITYSIRKRII